MIESQWRADFVATILGVVFVAIGLLGFVSNPLISGAGYFHVNAVHNFAHLITGALLLLSPYFGVPVMMIRALALIYTLIAILGFVAPNAAGLGALLAMSRADTWLHAAIAVVLLVIGFAKPVERSVTTAHM
jgi:hypothetical protein